MSEQALNILKLALLGLIYLFFARVLWAVWSEVRTPRPRQLTSQPARRPAAAEPAAAAAQASTVAQVRPEPSSAAQRRKPSKGRKGRAGRLVVLEPRHRRGLAVALDGSEITLGRDPNCTISITDDGYVSQLHLRIYDYDGQPMVEDLGSTNGTFHNGNKLIGSRVLSVGDRVQVGTTVIEAQ
ncbi:MAG: FHA domain-containing protein [Actinomycetota bacterium]